VLAARSIFGLVICGAIVVGAIMLGAMTETEYFGLLFGRRDIGDIVLTIVCDVGFLEIVAIPNRPIGPNARECRSASIFYQFQFERHPEP
jgi:hypothetical protein